MADHDRRDENAKAAATRPEEIKKGRAVVQNVFSKELQT